MELAQCLVCPLGQMREIFGELYWNDYENSYLVPVKQISEDDIRRLKDIGIDLSLYPLVEYLVATSESISQEFHMMPIVSV